MTFRTYIPGLAAAIGLVLAVFVTTADAAVGAADAASGDTFAARIEAISTPSTAAAAGQASPTWGVVA